MIDRVYAITGFSGRELLGIFASRKLAEDFLKDWAEFGPWYAQDYSIEECKTNKKRVIFAPLYYVTVNSDGSESSRRQEIINDINGEISEEPPCQLLYNGTWHSGGKGGVRATSLESYERALMVAQEYLARVKMENT